MSDEIEPVSDGEHLVVSDGDNLAVLGESAAVEKFLRSKGLWESSTTFDFGWLQPLVSLGGDAAQTASQIAAESARWVKLTKESAEIRKEIGLTATTTPGISWLIAGERGSISKWLQTESGGLANATNPATLSGVGTLLSGVAGVMAQLERKHEIAEITELLSSIDGKLDDVRRAQRDDVLAKLDGVTFAIQEATRSRSYTGHVSETTWSSVQHLASTIGELQSRALRELDAIAKSVESKSKAGDLASAIQAATRDVDVWLAVLARCFQLHEEIGVLRLDRVLEASPADLDGERLALNESRDDLRQAIFAKTQSLMARLDAAAESADVQILLHRGKSRTAVESSNSVGEAVVAFRTPLGIESDRESIAATPWRAALRDPQRLKSAGKEIGTKAAIGVGTVVTGILAVALSAAAKRGSSNGA